MFEQVEEEDQQYICKQSERLKNISPQNEFLKQGGHAGDVEVIFGDDILKFQTSGFHENSNEIKEQIIEQPNHKLLLFSSELNDDSEVGITNIQPDQGDILNQQNVFGSTTRLQELRDKHPHSGFKQKNSLNQKESQNDKTENYNQNNSVRRFQQLELAKIQNDHDFDYNVSMNIVSNQKLVGGGLQSPQVKQQESNFEENSIFSEQKQLNIPFTKEMGRNGQKGLSQKQKEYQDQREKQTKDLKSTKEIKESDRFERAIKIIQKVLSHQLDKVKRVENQVKKFTNILLIKSGHYGLHLDKQNLQFIGDKSYFSCHERKHFSLNGFIEQFSERIIMNFKIKAFMPTETFRIVWDICHLILTSLFLYMYSILIFCAQQQYIEKEFKQISYVFIFAFLFFSIDVLVNFNTAYFKKDLVVTNHASIASKYLRSYFFSDITALFILALKIFNNSIYLVYNPTNDLFTHVKNTLIFLKVAGLSSKRQRIQSVITLKDSQKHLFQLFNLITSIVIVAHIILLAGEILFQLKNQILIQFCVYNMIVGIGWNVMEIIEKSYDIEDTWTVKYNIADNDWQSKYIFSFYWSVTTMTTVGFGDITPANKYEAFFLSATMIFLSCIFAYSINNIGMILQEIQRNQKELTDNVSTIQNYLTRKNVNIALKSRVRNYLHFLAEEEKDRNKDKEDKVFKKLSNKLRDEITLEVNTRILHNTSIFSKNFSVQTLNKIVFKMVEQVISPNEIIFKQGDNTDQSIYFIFNGSIEIYNSTEIIQKGQQIQSTIFSKRLQSNQIFGEIQFFTGHARSASAKSVNLSTLYKLSQKDFIEILNENPEDLERYKMIQEQIIFQHDYSFIGMECYCCSQNGHIASECHIVHKKIDKQFHCLQSNFSLSQARQNLINPRKKFRVKPLMKLISIKNAQKHYKEQMNMNDQNKEKGEINSKSISDEEDDDDDEEDDEDSFSSSNFTDMTNSIEIEGGQHKKSKDYPHSSLHFVDPMYVSNSVMPEINPILTKLLMASINQEYQLKGRNINNNRIHPNQEKIKQNEENTKEDKSNVENTLIRHSLSAIQQRKSTKKLDLNENNKTQAEKKARLSKQQAQNLDQIQSDFQKEINLQNIMKLPQRTSEFIILNNDQTNNLNTQSSVQNQNHKKEKQNQKKQSKRGNESMNQIPQIVGTSNSIGISDDGASQSKKEEDSEKLIKIKRSSQKDSPIQNTSATEEKSFLNEMNSIRLTQNKLKSDEHIPSILLSPMTFTYQDLTRIITQTINARQSQIIINPAALAEKQQQEKKKKDSQIKEIDFITYNFDCLKIFKKFFPHNNVENVLQEIKITQIVKKRQVKQKQKMTYLNKNRRLNIFNNMDSPLHKQSVNFSRGSASFKQYAIVPQDNNNKNNSLYKESKPTFINYGFYIPTKKTKPINYYSIQESNQKL